MDLPGGPGRKGLIRKSHSEFRFHIIVKNCHEHKDADDHVCNSERDGDDSEKEYDTSEDGEEEDDEENDPDNLVEQGGTSISNLLVDEENDETEDDADNTSTHVVPESENTLYDQNKTVNLDIRTNDIEFIEELSIHDFLTKAEVKECTNEGSDTDDDNRIICVPVFNDFRYNTCHSGD